MNRVCLSALLVCLATLASSTASASPWTLRRGEIAVTAAYDQAWANREYLDDAGRDVPFSLNGRFRGSTMSLGVRAGFSDRLELEVQVPFKLVSYQADPVILIPAELAGEAESIDFYQRNVLDLSQTAQGVGDIRIYGRYNLLRWPVALAVEGRLKAPGGYDRPQGTFGDRPRDAEDFLARVGELVRPENVRDDVTLGDGQVDLGLSLLFGLSLPSRTFFRVDAGYDLRLGGAGDQIVASVKAGQLVGRRVLFYADARLAYAWQQGRVIGVSVAAIDPRLPASEYLGLNNLALREVTLDRDWIQLAVGGIVKITDNVEINVGYDRTLWGRNTSLVQSFYVTLGVRTQVQDAAPPVVEEEVVEEVVVEEVVVEEPVETTPVEAPPVEPAPVEPASVDAPLETEQPLET
ncbi:MAG: hypothetical protein H6722_16495 [Sandaracinus sp.]|nr:hypothetical protein [Sandaracinus sp.]MCB9614041.1 hypothetical protein [Sandaracinus sp.]MCB9620652.1 hypothetical protein [Sandaracinus sp.]